LGAAAGPNSSLVAKNGNPHARELYSQAGVRAAGADFEVYELPSAAPA
jgi:hypothetical protein